MLHPVTSQPSWICWSHPARGFSVQSAFQTSCPSGLPAAGVEFYTGEFDSTGFGGGLNRYRNSDGNWELTAPWAGAQVTVPAVCMLGDRDVVRHCPGGGPQMVSNLPEFVPSLKQSVVLEGCGH
jgi:hypothetical protein